MKKAIFIDRDGTIIAEPADEQVDSLEKLSFVPGAIGGLRALTGLGFELVMVTNQDGLGTPSFPEKDFLPPHEKMLQTLAGEGVVFDHKRRDDTVPLVLEPGAEFLLGHPESSSLYLKMQVGLLGAGDRGLGSSLWAQRPARPHHILTSPFLLAKKAQGLVRANC